MPLCTQSDIEALRQIDVTNEPDATITKLISFAEAKLEGLTGRTFSVVSDEVYAIEDLPEVDGVVYLAPFPITTLVVKDADDTTLEAGVSYHSDPQGRVYRLGAGTGIYTFDWQYHVPPNPHPWPGGTTFTITGGAADPDAIPQDLRLLAAEIAAQYYDKGTVPQALQNESLGGWAAGFRKVEINLDQEQMSVVRKYRHHMPVVAF